MFHLIKKKTITIPSILENLPKIIIDLVFECNYDHRKMFKFVLEQLVDYIHCEYCNGIIDCSLINKVHFCSAFCMDQLHNDYIQYSINSLKDEY